MSLHGSGANMIIGITGRKVLFGNGIFTHFTIDLYGHSPDRVCLPWLL